MTFDIDELIRKAYIGEEHLDQAEYEEVGRLLEELKITRKALDKACDILTANSCNCPCTCYGTKKCRKHKYDTKERLKKELMNDDSDK